LKASPSIRLFDSAFAAAAARSSHALRFIHNVFEGKRS
jgi:hypothetical protein